jgi:cytochrome c oxidase subunit IV
MSSSHPVSLKTYSLVFAALLVLTALTTGVAFMDLGGNFNGVVALAIAAGKAVLVALYFMHLRHGSRLSWIFAGAGFFWLIILVTLTLSDALTRSGSSPIAH